MATPFDGLSDDDIRAVADPIKRGRILRAISIDRRTLTPAQSAIWTDTIAELAGENLRERRPDWIAGQLRVGVARVRKIIRRAGRISQLDQTQEVAA